MRTLRCAASRLGVSPADRFVEIDYEALEFGFEAEARDRLVFCGLRWTEAVLDSARVRRAVNTASSFQVRHGLFSSSGGRWKNYDNISRDSFQLFNHAELGEMTPC